MVGEEEEEEAVVLVADRLEDLLCACPDEQAQTQGRRGTGSRGATNETCAFQEHSRP